MSNISHKWCMFCWILVGIKSLFCKFDCKIEKKVQFCYSFRRVSMKNRSEGYLLEQSASILTTYLASIVSCILVSIDRCPPILRMALKQLRHRVEEKFPDNDTVNVRFWWIQLGRGQNLDLDLRPDTEHWCSIKSKKIAMFCPESFGYLILTHLSLLGLMDCSIVNREWDNE